MNAKIEVHKGKVTAVRVTDEPSAPQGNFYFRLASAPGKTFVVKSSQKAFLFSSSVLVHSWLNRVDIEIQSYRAGDPPDPAYWVVVEIKSHNWDLG